MLIRPNYQAMITSRAVGCYIGLGASHDTFGLILALFMVDMRLITSLLLVTRVCNGAPPPRCVDSRKRTQIMGRSEFLPEHAMQPVQVTDKTRRAAAFNTNWRQ